MPPWLPTDACEDFRGDRRLTERQIETFKQWVAQGTKEGDPADLPETPKWTEGWHWGQPDLVIEMPEPYVLPADGPDVFYSFVIPIPVDAAHYVSTVEIRPDNRRVVHHAAMLLDKTDNSKRQDAETPGPGFPGIGRSKARLVDGHMPGYVPGRRTPRRRDDIAWRLEPGTDAVLELHMLPTGKPETLQVKIGFLLGRKRRPRAKRA